MSNNSRETLEACLEALYDMEKKGMLAKDDLWKALVQLAYTWFDEDQSGGVRVLAQIPSTYFQTTLEQQTKDDAEFAQLVVDFWKVLARYGILTPEAVDTNMPPASA